MCALLSFYKKHKGTLTACAAAAAASSPFISLSLAQLAVENSIAAAATRNNFCCCYLFSRSREDGDDDSLWWSSDKFSTVCVCVRVGVVMVTLM